MKKVKYLIGIILICIVVFIGIEVFRKVEHEEVVNNENTNIENSDNTITTNDNESEDMEDVEENVDNVPEQDTPIQNEETQVVKIKNGEELLEKADKILTAKGWAGASNNVVGIKDNILYYYNKGTGEFRKIATGIEDIYYEEFSEEITAKKSDNAEVLTQEFMFIVYE